MDARDVTRFATRLGGLMVGCGTGAAILLLVLAVLERAGLSGSPAGAIVGLGAAAALLGAALSSGTLRRRRFLVADQGLPAAPNGAAGALGAIPCGAALAGSALVLGAGLPAVLAILVGLGAAAFFGAELRRTGSLSLADHIGRRFGRRAQGLAAAATLAASLCLALAAALAFMTVAIRLLGLDMPTAAMLGAAAALVATLPGGLWSLTALAAGALGFALLGVAVVLVFGAKLAATGGPPLLAPLHGLLGRAEPPAMLDSAPVLFTAPEGFGSFAMLAVLAAGLAGAPHLLVRGAAAENRTAAAQTLGWALAFTALLAFTGAAAVAFSSHMLAEAAVGRSLGALAPAVRELVDAGIVKLCGGGDWEAARTACGARALAAGDIALDPSLALLGLPRLAGLPSGFSGLLLAGVAAELAAGLGAALLAAACAGTHDLFRAALPTNFGEGRLLALMRFALIVLAALTARVAGEGGIEPWAPAVLGLALSASTLLPALTLAATRLASPLTAFAAMGAGFAVTLTGTALFGIDTAPQWGFFGLAAAVGAAFAARSLEAAIRREGGRTPEDAAA